MTQFLRKHWGPIVATLALAVTLVPPSVLGTLLFAAGSRAAAQEITIKEIGDEYQAMSAQLRENTKALNELSNQVNLLNYRLSLFEESTKKHVRH